MPEEKIIIKGAREHNLKNIDLELPKNSLIIFTGVSGSGKSSLAFDTLYAEGQRRYVESLSAYARQFLGNLTKPDVDFIGGLSPAISIDQKSAGNNPRSTVATITEIYDYLRVLFASIGIRHCPKCGKVVGAQTADEIVEQILALPQRSRIQILAPIVKGRRGEYKEELKEALKAGFVRARVDGQIFDLIEEIRLDRNLRHDIEIVVDRIIIKEGVRDRVSEAVEIALQVGEGSLIVNLVGQVEHPDETGVDILYSQNYACAECNISMEPPTPQMFSFNSPHGMCPTCKGLGTLTKMSPDLVVPDKTKSIRDGAIIFWGKLDVLHTKHLAEGLAKYYNFSLDTPFNQLTEQQRQVVLYGSGGEKIPFVYRTHAGRRWHYEMKYEGVITSEERKYFQANSEAQQRFRSRFMTSVVCPDCNGDRLRPSAKTVTISDKSILDIVKMSVDECMAFFENLKLNERQQFIAEEVLKEIKGRLWFLMNVGLNYLTLDRTAPTLSGGESQRIRLASQIGAGLMGVLYILDEPSIGLHQRDNKRLLDTLKHLRDQGNTVIIAEHDEETIRSGDYIVDFGPGAGIKGGEIVATGTPCQISENERSLTGQYFSGRQQILIPAARRPIKEKWIEIIGAKHNNLKNIAVKIPLGLFTCVTGVSGSGKSSLINDILFQALDRDLWGFPKPQRSSPGAYDAIKGIEYIDKVIDINQSPIGRTPRSNPATYVKVFDEIRNLYAQLPESQMRGYKPGRFSFNVKGGRCEACQGGGLRRIEMHFLADVWVKCEVCGGKRYNNETLQVRYKGKHITDVLDMDVQEALEHFENLPKITRILQTLHDVGLDYIKLGQPAPTLSGGEAQRIKLARELRRVSTGKTLYILDEPTTGLHFADVKHLLNVLHRLTDAGNTIVVIEHNPEVIKTADYIIDLGPEGGEEGGRVIATGTPEEVAQVQESYTGQMLRNILQREFGMQTSKLFFIKEKFDQKKQEESEIRNPKSEIRIRGAKEHNLKNINVDIPHRQMTVFTGISGSGKSSLALDTIYAEGQRRYIESLSAYARQFLGQIQKPKVERIDGLSPAIAIEQKTPSQNPRSTVGTVTEIYDYMRVLYARVGTPHCPKCGREISAQTTQQIVDQIIQLEEGSRIYVLSPLKIERNEDYDVAVDRLQKDGYARVRIDGEIYDLSERSEQIQFHTRNTQHATRNFPRLDRRIKHDIEVVVDRLVVRPDEQSRLYEAVETSLRQSGGIVTVVQHLESENDPPPAPSRDGSAKPITQTFSEHFACVHCGLSFRELTPQHFSFNSPLGMCEGCEGLGVTKRGTVCRRCKGARIQPEARAVTLGGKSIVEVTAMTIREAAEFFDKLSGADIPVCHAQAGMPAPHLTETQMEIAKEVIKEIRNRLRFLVDIGLHYLTLDRPAPTLAGGEAQRIRLASQLGSGLTGVLYVLDEPTIGLHPRDSERLLNALKNLRDLGNSVIVVEHDQNTILSSDRVVDFGPGAGAYGGEIVAEGSCDEIQHNEKSLTGKYLSGELSIEIPQTRRHGKGQFIQIIGAQHNNLKNLDVKIPLGTLTGVTGVSGSGKSSLVEEILYKAVAFGMRRTSQPNESIAFDQIGAHEQILGTEHIDKVINIDQKPIGETPRSNPATYTDVFTDIRYLFAELPEAKMKGFSSRRFSFNLKVGQCESCKGNGYNRIEMHFLPDVWVKCDTCGGTGYNRQTLEIRYKGKNIAEVLEMTVQEALEHFHNIPTIQRKLQTLCDVGLDYIQLGQSATTLSGGEAQRVKLAKELARRSTGKTLYIMDEPTTGLHFADIKHLLKVMHRLVDKGNTIVVIEHNMDVIKCADYIIDLGPEGGDEGGYIVACGTPEEIVQVEASHTGRFLKEFLVYSR
ncbi:excinuclease ABC subunit UvrA [Candidatus Poribacteria bacterium]|nr:excinuclease ABC subunit UvrA [Candidatus Poribacteria bacterium]